MKPLERGSLPRSWLSAICLILLSCLLHMPVEAASLETPNNLTVAVDTQTRIPVTRREKGQALYWYSSNPDVAAVDSNGKVTGISEGTATIFCEGNEGADAEVVRTKVRVLPTATVRNQDQLVEAISSGDYGRVVYQTDRAGEVVLLEGEYHDVELVVDAPNLSIINYANFKRIFIQQISPNTWTECATGNNISVTAPRSSIIIRDDARVSELVISGERCNLTVHGKVDSIRASGVGRLSLKGRANAAAMIQGNETRDILFPATLQISDTGDITVIKGNAPVSTNTRSGVNSSASTSSSDRSGGGGSGGSSNTPSGAGGIGTGSGSGGTGAGGGSGNGNGSGGDGSNEGGSDGDGSGSEITVAGISVTSPPDTTAYQTGDTLDLTGLSVAIDMSDGSSTAVEADQLAANGLETTPAHGATLSINNNAVTIRHQSGRSTSVPITVTDPPPVPVIGIWVKTEPKKEYLERAPLDLTGLLVTLELENQSTVDVPFDAFVGNGLTANPAHGTALSLTNEEVEIRHVSGNDTCFSIEVDEREPDSVQSLSIVTPPDKVAYKDGESLDLTGLVLALHYDDGVEWEVPYAQFDAYDLVPTSHAQGDSLSEGPVEVVIKHTPSGETVSIHLTVGEADLIGIEITSPPTKFEYIEGESLDLSGLSVDLKYSNGTDIPVSYGDFDSQGITVTSEDDIGGGLTPNGNVSEIEIIVSYLEWSGLTQVSVGRIKSMKVVTEPNTTTYMDGQLLDLGGLTVEIEYHISNGTDTRNVSHTEFATFGIEVDPEHETSLVYGFHSAIILSHDTVEIEDDMIFLDIQ